MISRKLLCNAILANSAFYSDTLSFTCKCGIKSFASFYAMFQVTIENSVSQHFTTVYPLVKQKKIQEAQILLAH